MNKLIVFAAAGAVASGIAMTALAHSGATGVVKERMDAMKAMGDAVKSTARMVQGETAYDPEAIRETAAVIKENSGEAMTKLFPEHSMSDVSEAKHEIWDKWDEFARLSVQLELLAGALEKAADNGLMHGGDGTAAAGMGNGGMMGNQNMMGSGSGMMGGGNMMSGSGMMMGSGNGMPDADHLAQMPADGVFNMMTRTCSACHTKFRQETN